MISSKYFPIIAIVLTSVVLVLCVLAMGFSDKLAPITNSSGYTMEYKDILFDTDKILDINIIMDETQWDEMLASATDEVYRECDIEINGTTFYQVGIRPKGNTSLSSIARDSDNNRYSFKLEFDQFVEGQTCFGLDKLILNNNYADATNMKEAVIYDMFRFLDADASLYNYAKISVNNEYWGAYLALEAVEESFMLRNFGNEMGHLYKPDSMNFKNNNKAGGNKQGNNFPPMPEGGFPMPEGDFQMPEGDFQIPEGDFPARGENEGGRRQFPGGREGMERGGFPGGMGGGSNLNYTDDNLDSYSAIQNGQVTDSTTADHRRIIEALKNIHNRTDIEKYINVDQILKYMAVHNFSVNEDSLSGAMAHNYYLYEANGRISILPWDYNLALGGMHGGDGTEVINDPIDELWQGTKLFDFVLEDGEYKARYHEHYQKLVDEYLYGGEFDRTFNRIKTQIDSLVKTDPNAMYSYEEYTKGSAVFYQAVMLRAESIKGQLDGSIPSTSEGQQADPSKLVDASGINLSDMGRFNMGGGFGGKDRKMR